MSFVLLEETAQVINRDDVGRVSTTIDIVVNNEAVIPQSSVDRFQVRTSRRAVATISLVMKGTEEVVPYKTVTLNLASQTEDLFASPIIAALDDEKRNYVTDRVMKSLNHMQKEENFNAMLAQRDAQQQQQQPEDNELAPMRPATAYNIAPPFSDKDMKNQRLRLEKIQGIISEVTETHENLSFSEAKTHADEASLTPVIQELKNLTGILNK